MIIGHKINSNMFSHFKDEKEFSQEISSLGAEGGKLFRRLYDDACDEGFVMVSAKTGAEVPFALESIEKSDEGEIQCWNFTVASLRPSAQGYTVTVFND